MVIDTSALIATLLREPDAEIFVNAIADDLVKVKNSITPAKAGVQNYHCGKGKSLMAIFYADSSALVKRHVNETDQAFVGEN